MSPPLTCHKLHDDHDRLPLGGDADEADDVGVVVLLEYPPLLEELPPLVLRQRVLTCLHCYNHTLGLVDALVHLSKVSLGEGMECEMINHINGDRFTLSIQFLHKIKFFCCYFMMFLENKLLFVCILMKKCSLI